MTATRERGADLGGLVAASRLSRRRMVKLRSPRGADMMLQAWLVIVVFIRFATNCSLAWRELSRGTPAVGSALAEFSMLHFLLLAFLLAFLSSILSLGAAGLDRRRLALSGLRMRQLLPAEAATLVSRPMTGVIALFLVPALFPLLRLPRPGAALAALVLVFVAALLAGAGLSTVLTLHRSVHRLSGVFRYAFVAVLVALVFVNFDFDWAGSSVRLFVFQNPTLLVNDAGAGLLPSLRPWGPWSWVVDGRAVPCALLAAAAFAFYLLVTAAGFRKLSVINPATARGRGTSRQGLHAASPGIFEQELRHFLFSGAGGAGAVLGVGAAVWLLFTAHPSAGIPLAGAFFVLIAGFSHAVNLFGQDAGAVRRYALGGVPWDAVFRRKNRAWLTVCGASCVPLVIAAAVRLTTPSAVSFALSAVLVLLLAVAWGNISSLLFASPRSTADAPGAARVGPPFVNQAAPLLAAGIVLAVHRVIGPFGSAVFDVAIGACAGAAAIFTQAYLRRVSRSFDDELEGLLEKLRG
jgi:hypothetical protein